MKDLLNIPAETLRGFGIVGWGHTTETLPRSFATFETWAAESREHLPFLLNGKSAQYRADLKAWYPAAQSALVFMFSYAPAKKVLRSESFHRIAGYALGFDGADYHAVVKARLFEVARLLKQDYDFEWKFTHDTEPVLERDLAYRAGLGWFGKNSMLIHRQHGSYFIIGSLILDRVLPLEAPEVDTDHCGQCRLCVDACPTDAIDPETRTIRAKQCISTWTIEDRSADTPAPVGLETAREEIFGCDICQDVCPWNGKPLERVTAQIGEGARRWMTFFGRDLGEIGVQLSWVTNRAFLRLMEGTAFARPGRRAFLRSIGYWMKR